MTYLTSTQRIVAYASRNRRCNASVTEPKFDIRGGRVIQFAPNAAWWDQWHGGNSRGLSSSTGDPSPNVTWWRGSVLFDDDFSIIKQRFVRNEMVLEKLQRSELMVEYTCKASNTHLAKPKTASVQIDMNRE
ncbi:hypothetical protein AVEN_206172-1 [Araneus ventricosus]|uniref:Ig-like domain-containing protein n=1 Tax=Araneus ventricosus TaxID=182803 RepID=A0A4Y2EF56_ARAVE|nr:hypothetical protein AVEN_206172-1 [Araneus ventricosus]